MTDWGLPRADGTYAQTMGRREARLPPADETPAQPRHSDPGEPCQHPHCVAKAAASVDAGSTDRQLSGDVYEAAARFTLAGLGETEPTGYQITAWSGDRAFRAGVDASRAVAARELAEVTRERDEARAILDYALTLRMYGENAPGGTETWREFDRRCETYLRRDDDRNADG